MLTDSPVARLQVRIGQKIGTGNADLRRSITGGLTNAVGGAIYGNSPLKNAGQALLRGGAAGAASSGINYLSDALDTRKIREDALRRMAQGSVSPYARRSDPSGLCSVPDPFAGGVGYPAVRGYRYEGHTATGTAGKGGFNLADFGKELLTGFVAGGLSSAAFYGAGKAVEAVKGSVRGVCENDVITMSDSYVGVKQASKYLQSQGVPRKYRKQILESFDIGTIKLQTAGENTYGLRFYGGNANVEGRYLFETFSPLINRQNLALPYEWNSMTGIQQFQVRNGIIMITGNVAVQNSFGSQYIGGAKQWYINNLEDLIKCQ